PLSQPAPRIARSFQPYIYSRNELQRLLDATAILHDNRWPLQQTTFPTEKDHYSRFSTGL
ncbi:MAG: hypothetical protein ACR2RB_15570, partial [Gammaproteobacteria bacterium]